MKSAEQFLQDRYQNDLNSFQDNVEALKQFAQMHAEAALSAGAAAATIKDDPEARTFETCTIQIVDRDAIRNAYPSKRIR